MRVAYYGGVLKYARSVAICIAMVSALLPLSARAQASPSGPPGAQLLGRAVLAADTFADGPPSGARITGPTNDRKVPFASQPVQGFSGIISAGGGAYWGLIDNGYGVKDNSADSLLRVYKLRLNFKTAVGGPGTVAVESFIQLRDSDHKVPFAIVNETTPERLLTGADFDPESIRRDNTGDLWFGDEFGPFLLHTDASGRLLDSPYPLPGVKAPQNPTLNLAAGEKANLGTSRGFEGMGIAPDGSRLYPILEGALTDDLNQRRRYIYAFDLQSKQYLDQRWQYRMDSPGNSLGDMTSIDPNRMLVIERDQEQGDKAALKKIYAVDLRVTDADGLLTKTPIVDLLAIRDPNNISGPARVGDIGIGDPFKFPFVTTESVLNLDGNVLLIANDNNYPFSNGRNFGRPDDNEFILVQLDQSLPGTTPGTAWGGH
jgi:hypothetical protein